MRDTPIAEEAIAGIAVGAAFIGLRPIAEMMTFNFSLLALDMIVNHAAKYRYMSGGQMRCPMVMRGPSGAATQVAAQHSQAFESWYAHIPGLVVVMPSTPKDAKGLLKSAIRDDNPVIFMENEILYNLKGEVPDEEYHIPLGLGDIKREGKDVTIVAWSRSVITSHGRGQDAGRGGHRGRGRGPAHAAPAGRGHHLRVRAQDGPLRRGRGGLAHTPASARRSPTACSASASTPSTRPSSASPPPTCPCRTPRRSRRRTCRSPRGSWTPCIRSCTA